MAVLLVAGCTKEEQDWLIGRWFVTECSYVNEKTGGSGKCDPGFDMWEFTDRGRLLVDGGKVVQEYRHTEGHIIIEAVVFDIVKHEGEMMWLEHKSVNGVTFYTFTR